MSIISFRPSAAARTIVALTPALWSVAAMTSPFKPPPPDSDRPAATRRPAAPAPARPTANRDALPFARGRQFATLDDYLAFRREQGAIDLPWYEEVAPGIYELRTRLRPAPPPRRYTRAELARQFGFER